MVRQMWIWIKTTAIATTTIKTKTKTKQKKLLFYGKFLFVMAKKCISFLVFTNGFVCIYLTTCSIVSSSSSSSSNSRRGRVFQFCLFFVFFYVFAFSASLQRMTKNFYRKVGLYYIHVHILYHPVKLITAAAIVATNTECSSDCNCNSKFFCCCFCFCVIP